MKMLDLCCGRGGWSDAFAELGYECTGLDIRKFRDYKHRFIRADIFDWQPTGQYDVICASPLCTQFSHVNLIWNGRSDERQGLDMVYRVYEIIHILKPKFYIIENVKGLASFLPECKATFRYGSHKNTKTAYLWGNFPPIPITFDNRSKTSRETYIKDPSILSKIHPCLARGLALSILECSK